MIPRFIVRDADHPEFIKLLQEIGYTCKENPVPKDILLLGNTIVQAPHKDKNPLTVNFILRSVNDMEIVLNQAILHRNWSRLATTAGLEIRVMNDKATVHITKVGVLIDNFVVTMERFAQLANYLKGGILTDLPYIATHKPVPAKVKDSLTIGCADYTLVDFDKIMAAYNSLFN